VSLGFFSAVSARFSLVLDPQDRLGGKVGALVRYVRTIKVVYRVNVYESYGASSPSLSRIKGCSVVVDCCI